ncbi:MAG: hypothetical protein L6405_08055 [Actinomycetia bacterium]|nr:hypothetical protein [Actinomycetes bacterium]
MKLLLPADCRLNRSGSATSVHEVGIVAKSPFFLKYTTLSCPQASLLSTNSCSFLYWGMNGWVILNVFLPSARNVVDVLCERPDRKIMGDPAG